VLLEKFKETTKSARDTADVNPQTRAQSKRRPKNNSPSLVGECNNSHWELNLIRKIYGILFLRRWSKGWEGGSVYTFLKVVSSLY
jgi:hypothetical protein